MLGWQADVTERVPLNKDHNRYVATTSSNLPKHPCGVQTLIYSAYEARDIAVGLKYSVFQYNHITQLATLKAVKVVLSDQAMHHTVEYAIWMYKQTTCSI